MTAKKQNGLSWTGSAGAASYRIYRNRDDLVRLYRQCLGDERRQLGLTSGMTYTYYVAAMGTAESGPSRIFATAR